jgi:hypothetical protein
LQVLRKLMKAEKADGSTVIRSLVAKAGKEISRGSGSYDNDAPAAESAPHSSVVASAMATGYSGDVIIKLRDAKGVVSFQLSPQVAEQLRLLLEQVRTPVIRPDEVWVEPSSSKEPAKERRDVA